MASNLYDSVCVYTHGYYMLEKEKERKEEDNETLAQLKAFFLPPLLSSFIFRDSRQRDTTIESS